MLWLGSSAVKAAVRVVGSRCCLMLVKFDQVGGTSLVGCLLLCYEGCFSELCRRTRYAPHSKISRGRPVAGASALLCEHSRSSNNNNNEELTNYIPRRAFRVHGSCSFMCVLYSGSRFHDICRSDIVTALRN